MYFILGNYTIEIDIWIFLVAVILLAIPLWIVYRPDKKLSQKFGISSDRAQSQSIKFENRKSNQERWQRIKTSLDSANSSSWREAMKEIEKLIHEVFDKLEPEIVGEALKLESLINKNSSWLNMREPLRIKNEILGDGLDRINYSQLESVIEKIEKIFEEIEFI